MNGTKSPARVTGFPDIRAPPQVYKAITVGEKAKVVKAGAPLRVRPGQRVGYKKEAGNPLSEAWSSRPTMVVNPRAHWWWEGKLHGLPPAVRNFASSGH